MSYAPTPLSVSHADIFKLAAPIILANLSIPLVGAVDTAVVGHLAEPHHMGAIAFGALIFTFVYWGFGFLRMGTTGYIARANNDAAECGAILVRGLILAAALAGLLIVLQWPILLLALELLGGTERVESLAAEYFNIRVWSAPGTLIIYVCTGVLIGLRRTRGVLLLQLTLNLTNVMLDLLFVPFFGWGVPGVALATLLSEYLAAITGLWLLKEFINLDGFHLAINAHRDRFSGFLATNANIFIRTLCLIFSFSWFTAQSAKFGEVTLAANAVLMHLMTTMAHGLDGFAHAAETLTGNAYGARRARQFSLAVRRTTAWAAGTALLTSLIYYVFGATILSWFTDIDNVLLKAGSFLPWVIASPLLSVWSYQLDGVFIGTGKAREMRNAMLISTACYLLLLHWLIPAMDNHGLWLGLMLFMVIRAITLLGYYPRLVPS